ncbi:MAG: hypothetical protein ACRDSZ_03210 [Pseudonocardiaceae bacterium]
MAAAVRDGELSPEQREQLVTLLHWIDSAHKLASLVAQRYLDAPDRRRTTRLRAGSRSAPRTPSCWRL